MKQYLFSHLPVAGILLLFTVVFSSCKKESLAVPGYVEYSQTITSDHDSIVIPAYNSHTSLKSVVISTQSVWIDSSYQLAAEHDTAGYAITFSRGERLASTLFTNGYDSAYKETTYKFDLTEDLRTFTTHFLNNERMIYDSVTTNLSKFQGSDLKFVFSGSVDLGTQSQLSNGAFGVYYLANTVTQSEVITVRYYY